MSPSCLGCPTTVYRIALYNPHEPAETDKLWNALRDVDSDDNLLTARLDRPYHASSLVHPALRACSVPGEDKWSNTEGRDLGGPGLVSGHACKALPTSAAIPC